MSPTIAPTAPLPLHRKTAAPFLKWAGSKRWLLPTIQALAPTNFNSYYEPFLGSGATYFAVSPGHPAYLSDTIPALINCFAEVLADHKRVSNFYTNWLTDAESYYRLRSTVFDDKSAAAAQFIYLNKLCFNGLYRENQAGAFNVPYGRPKTSNIVDPNMLSLASRALASNASLRVCDFEIALQDCQENDFVYLDPPYVNSTKSNAFAEYNANTFDWADQKRLAAIFYALESRGVHVLLSNGNHQAIRELYASSTQHQIPRYSSMSSLAKTRGLNSELLIMSRTLVNSK
jgi:DNA adenine methylase